MQLDFIGVGPQRAGTTWLYRNLADHPQITFPRQPIKETFFFDQHYDRGFDWYVAHFPRAAADSRIGEIAPTYFDSADALQRIATHNPTAKIIISLRNPIERARSMFLHYAALGTVPLDFATAIEQEPRIITSNFYSRYLPAWQQQFGAANVALVLLDDIKAQPTTVFSDTCRFLGIDDNVTLATDEKVNQAILPGNVRLCNLKLRLAAVARDRHWYGALRAGKRAMGLIKRIPVPTRNGDRALPELTAEQYAMLINTYHDEIDYLESTLGRSLTGWRERNQQKARYE